MAQLAGSSVAQPEERYINVCCSTADVDADSAGGFALAARVWHAVAVGAAVGEAEDAELRRVVMWPGRLDNAATFDQIGARLAGAGFTCVAVDPPGCGLSAHRKACDYYNDYDEALLILEVADAAWGSDSKFCAFGHASGGAIAAAAAAAFPHRCIALVVFESTLGLAGTGWADVGVGFGRLNETYREDKIRRTAPPLRFQDLDAAAEVLPAPASLQTSQGLLRRQFRRESSDWVRTVDRRLVQAPASGPQCVVTDEAMNVALLTAVNCPTQLLSSSSFEAKLSANGASPEWLSLLETRRTAIQEGVDPSLYEEHMGLSGDYYFVADAADETAELVLPFLIAAVTTAANAHEVVLATVPRIGPPAREQPDPETLAAEATRAEQGRADFEQEGGLPTGLDAGHAIDVVTYKGTLRIACRHWPARPQTGRNDAQGRILCYSGWLDNTGSFATLAPLLSHAGYDVVAMDSPGSGRSAHLPPEAWYRTEHEAVLIMEVADAIGWGDTVRFTLFAHSRGTSVGLIAACAFPERVDRVVLVESRLGYGFGEPEQAAAQMRAAYITDRRNRSRTIRSFADLDEAVAFSFNDPTFPKGYATSFAITCNKLRQRGDGALVFTHDMRTYGQAVPLYPQEYVTREALTHLEAPILLIQGTDGFHARDGNAATEGGELALSPMQKQMRARVGKNEWSAMQARMRKIESDFQERRKLVPHLTEVTVPGQHHCHSDSPRETAARVLSWLAVASGSKL